MEQWSDRLKDLPSEGTACILEFCMDEYRKLTDISKAWRLQFNEAMDTLCR